MDSQKPEKANNQKTKNTSWEKIIGFIFGAVIIATLLTLNIFLPNPSETQHETFKIILALAAAGIGAVLAGFINIKGKIKQLSFRSGGALALFVIVFFFNPSKPGIPTNINQINKANDSVQIGVNEGEINITTNKEKK